MPEPEGRITLWGIEVFLAVAEEGALSTAARRLGVSIATISQQLSNLETALGAVLIDRGARPVQTTPAGEMFRTHAQTIINTAQEARTALSRADLGHVTTLRLGMIEDFEADVTPGLLSALAPRLPSCRFLLETGPSHRLAEKLESRALDVIVAADMVLDSLPIEGCDYHPILTEPFLAITPKNHSSHAFPHDLPFVQYSTRHVMGRQIAAHMLREGLHSRTRFELDSYRAILAMVAAGEAWAILPPLALHHQGPRFSGAITAAPLPCAPLSRQLSLLARKPMLGDIPALIARELREQIDAQVIAPSHRLYPWLARDFRLM